MLQPSIEQIKIPKIEFLLTFLSYLLAGTVSTLISVYLPEIITDLHNKEVSSFEIGELGALINSCFIFGWMAGGLIMGLVSDRIGRIGALAISTFIFGATILSIKLVNHIDYIIVFRFLSGFGVGGVLVVSTVYISEIFGEKDKPIYLGMLATGFPLGIVLTGIINLFIKDWREALLIGFIPMAISILTLAFAKESSVWKNSPHKINFQPIFWKDFFKSNSKNLWIGSSIFGCVLIGLWGIFSWMPTWIHSLAPDELSGQKAGSLSMMIFGLGGILGSFLSGYLVKKFGIQNTLVATLGGCLFISILIFLTTNHINYILYFETALLSIFFGISQGSLSTYIPSLFATQIRTTASGFCFNISRFITGIAVFFVGNLAVFFGGLGNSLLVFSTPFGIALIVTLLTCENKIINKIIFEPNYSQK
ncbi:MAG: MFS transporter [Saprospiraceae bacterium]|nr:MFS transporter [Saprospiraceae bacterium]HRG33439.1 MFS transporter [Saprospiraceae bacterium]